MGDELMIVDVLTDAGSLLWESLFASGRLN